MKPLVYYCRWQGASLRLRGRNSESVWGQLVTENADGQEEARDFRFQLESAELIVQDEQGEDQYLWLDDRGIPLSKKV